ncbi:MAG: hypothetical protein ABIO86_07765 [Sphingomonas sp.]
MAHDGDTVQYDGATGGWGSSRPMTRFAPLLLPLLLGGCEGLQSPLNPAGDQARGTDFLFALMTWICVGMYLLIISFLGATIWRGRVPPAQDAAPAVEPTGNGLRNLLFWGIAIVIGLTVLIVASVLVGYSLAAAKDREAIVVRATTDGSRRPAPAPARRDHFRPLISAAAAR